MSLDQNLFTLHLTSNKDNPNIVDLVDPSGTVHYSKHRLPGAEYKIESLLITATSPNATSKTKKLELYNPTIIVELKYTGTLSFRWNFKFEEHEFEWKREECYMLRKPDPPVLIAITKEPAGRLKTSTVQILDYNLNRFDINDRKGLEIVILTALLTFSDVNEGYHAPQETVRRNVERTPPAANAPAVSRQTQPAEEAPPLPPPKPAPKTGVERIAEMQAALGEYNEICVEEEGQVQHYAEYCSRLLEDDAMLFVTIRSAAAEQVPKVLQVVQETKRIRYKAGLSEEAELRQYVVYDELQKKKKGPGRINLDNVKPTTTATYTPPTSLTVHLSKIDMPELQPKATLDERPSGSTTRDMFKDTSSQESSPGRESKAKSSKRKDEKKVSGPTTPPANSSKLIKHGRSSSPAARGHAQSSQPHQPSPSPPHVSPPSSYTGPPGEQASRPTYSDPVPFPIPSVPSHGALNTGWEPPTNSYVPQPDHRFGAYAPPPHHPSVPSGVYPPSNSAYNPSYTASPPSYVPPPLPPRPPASHGPPSPHKPSVAASLLDSFRRR